jgi:hypothetical protein
MSMPLQAVDRLFSRLTMTYGPAFTRTFEGLEINEVKSLWSHELSFYCTQERMMDVAWALENLPERAPNVIEFKNLCRKAPAKQLVQLPEAKADPARLRKELARLGEIKIKAMSSKVDHREWAKRIIARHEAGDKPNPTSLRFAREALA